MVPRKSDSGEVQKIGGIHQRWSPRGRPWPRGHVLKSLASARGQHYFLNFKNFVERLKNILENVFLWRSPEKFM